ncbi:MAG: hypothetical protein EOO07_19440 [Chitinophagaceae bacterium]|nr:MAG: hypothetical protein EOO07_19440 [Chitinophagaceae bacterium]
MTETIMRLLLQFSNQINFSEKAKAGKVIPAAVPNVVDADTKQKLTITIRPTSSDINRAKKKLQ